MHKIVLHLFSLLFVANVVALWAMKIALMTYAIT
jgi:hypothetical protein